MNPVAHTHQRQASTDETSRTSGWTHRLPRVLIVAAIVLSLVYAAAGWYISGEIIDGLVSSPYVVEYDTAVMAVSGTSIELAPADEGTIEADRDAVMGIRWEGGYAQVGPATSWTDTIETRPFELLSGTPPRPGDDIVDFDSFAFPPDPTAIGITYETVTYPSELGELEAWLVPGNGATWIVAVHGRGSDRPDMLRLITSIADLRYPTLVVRIRNDIDSPSTDGSLLLAGQEEWRDVAAAVDYAVEHGAEDVILAAPSMGAALVLGYTLEQTDAPVRALILEAPVADFREIVALRSGEALPIGGVIGDSLLAVGRMVTWLRVGLDFDTVDYIDRAGDLDAPILLFHGTDDTTVPFQIGRSLADARPDLVEFHPIPDAAHVRAWNEDPDGYSQIVREFLDRIGRS